MEMGCPGVALASGTANGSALDDHSAAAAANGLDADIKMEVDDIADAGEYKHLPREKYSNAVNFDASCPPASCLDLMHRASTEFHNGKNTVSVLVQVPTRVACMRVCA